MRLTYQYYNEAADKSDTVIIEGNNAKDIAELLDITEAEKKSMFEQLTKDFDINELALYIYIELKLSVIELIEVTDVVEKAVKSVLAPEVKQAQKTVKTTRINAPVSMYSNGIIDYAAVLRSASVEIPNIDWAAMEAVPPPRRR